MIYLTKFTDWIYGMGIVLVVASGIVLGTSALRKSETPPADATHETVAISIWVENWHTPLGLIESITIQIQADRAE